MSFDTSKANKRRQNLELFDEIWLFGYGSLIYKVDFPIIDKRPALIYGWQRRFWQGSHDHRGTPESPGRVLTLVKKTDAVCAGMAYQVSADVFEHLDHREKNGYLRHEVTIYFGQYGDPQLSIQNVNSSNNVNSGNNINPGNKIIPGESVITGLVYIGSQDNEAFLGDAPDKAIARQIRQSKGPSGPNDEYVYRLADGLRALKAIDTHVFNIEQLLKKMKA